jgi:hypothetical protein
MQKSRIKHFIYWASVISIISCLPIVAGADDIWSKFHPFIGVSEEYNDNVYLTRDNRIVDFITTIYPGIRFSHTGGPFGIDLDYTLGLNFYADQTNLNYVSHTGNLNTFYRFYPNWTFRLRDYFIRSEDPLSRDYGYTGSTERYNLSVDRSRSVYLRNVVEPAIEYQFGRENRVSLLYRNNIYQTERDGGNDSTENAVNPVLSYWFNIRNGMVLDYTFSAGNFEQDPDLVGHSVRGRYIYRFNPHSSVFGEFVFLAREYESPGTDYNVYNPSLGLEHAFSSTLNGVFQIGYFWQDAKGIPTFSGPTFNISLTQRAQFTTYNIGLEGGYREDLFTSQNLGFTKYYRAFGSITYQLYRRTSLGFYITGERAEYSQAYPGRIDWIGTASGTISHQPLKWLTISLVGSHRRDTSNQNEFDYTENRVILRLTATF